MSHGEQLDNLTNLMYDMGKDKNTIIVFGIINGILNDQKLKKKIEGIVKKFPTLSCIVGNREGYLRPYKVWEKSKIMIDNHYIRKQKREYSEKEIEKQVELVLTRFAFKMTLFLKSHYQSIYRQYI